MLDYNQRVVLTEYDGGSKLKLQVNPFRGTYINPLARKDKNNNIELKEDGNDDTKENMSKKGNRVILQSKPIKHKTNSLMTTRNQKRTLIKKHKIYIDYKLDKFRCLELTLTTQSDASLKKLLYSFDNLIRDIRKVDKSVKYIRALEITEDTNLFHIHAILVFKYGTPKAINQEWFNRHWHMGFSMVKKGKDPYGFLDYMTQFDPNAKALGYDGMTKFKSYTRLLTCSNDMEKSQKNVSTITYGEMLDIIKIKADKQFIYYEGHYFFDKELQAVFYCLDRIYVH